MTDHPRRANVFSAVRAFAVMAGGSVVLLLAAAASVITTVGVLVNGERPPWIALAGAVVFAAYIVVIRPWTRRWGTTPDERTKTLPGDEAVPNPGVSMTRAVTIDAPPEQVWPWIAQIGQDRGGFYSYTWAENLAGCHMRNADRIHPEWQQRQVGDRVPLHPLAGIALSRFDPDRSYALQGWYFALEGVSGKRTRLYARSRIPRGMASVNYSLFIELPHFIMERKMLRTLKQLVERDPARLEQARALALDPWSGPSTDKFVEIPLDIVLGRRIRHRPEPFEPSG